MARPFLTRRSAAMTLAAAALSPQAFAQRWPAPFFDDTEALPKEFEFDLRPTSTFLREYPPGSRLIAKAPATLTMEFQLTEARRDNAFPQFPPSVSLWLISPDEAVNARIQIADDPMAQTMMMQIKCIDRRTAKSTGLLVDVTELKKGAVNTVTLGVGKDGVVKMRAPSRERAVQLPFSPARLGVAAMGAKGWMRFPDGPMIS